MTDETDKPAVTDSRFAGFDPEVEASHPELAAAKPAIPTPPPPPPEPPAPVVRPLAQIVGDLVAQIVDHLGNPPRFNALLEELSSVLSK